MPASKKRKENPTVTVKLENGTSAPRYSYSSKRGLKYPRKFPKEEFQRVYQRRFTPEGIAHHGDTWATATPEQREARKAVGWYGRGSYWGRAAGGYLGRQSGIPGAAAMGAHYGDIASSWLNKRWKGRGMYTGRGSYNSLISGGDSPMGVMSSGDETESVVFSNREYIGDVYGAPNAQFLNEKYELNPGIQSTFPWLSQIAANYEEYEFIQLVFEYKSTIDSSTAGDGQSGTVMMATNYNANQPIFKDKELMMQYHGGQSARTTQDMAHGVECSPDKAVGDMQKFIRTGPVAIGEDIKSYDHGTFQLGQNNQPAIFNNDQIGELWVSYSVKLMKPKLGTARMTNQQRDVYVALANKTAVMNHLSTSNLFDVAPQKATKSSLGTSFVKLSDIRSRLLLPASFNGTIEVILTADTLEPGIVCDLAVGGNVRRVRDIFGTCVNPSGSDVAKNFAASYDTCNGILIARFSVKAATSGTSNYIDLWVVNTSNAQQNLNIKSLELDVREIVDFSDQNTDSDIPMGIIEGI